MKRSKNASRKSNKPFFKRIMTALGLAMKGGDEVIMKGNGANETKISEERDINENNVYAALLRGELTEEVKQLRYALYRVENESKNYTYLGNGVSVKTGAKNKESFETLTRIVQRNTPQVNELWKDLEGFSDETKLGFDEERYARFLISIEYEDLPKFRLEKYIDTIDIDIMNKTFTLSISDVPDIERPITKALCNELSKVVGSSGYEFEHCFLSKSANFIRFVANDITYNHENAEVIIDKFKFTKVTHENGYYYIHGDIYNIILNNITNDFYNEEMDRKYKEKAPKKNNALPYYASTSILS